LGIFVQLTRYLEIANRLADRLGALTANCSSIGQARSAQALVTPANNGVCQPNVCKVCSSSNYTTSTSACYGNGGSEPGT
jgi:hypothetical protein